MVYKNSIYVNVFTSGEVNAQYHFAKGTQMPFEIMQENFGYCLEIVHGEICVLMNLNCIREPRRRGVSNWGDGAYLHIVVVHSLVVKNFWN